MYTVIERMLNAIPDKERLNYPYLIDRLNDLQDEARRSSPDKQQAFFSRASDLTDTYLANEDEEWKTRVKNILGDAL